MDVTAGCFVMGREGGRVVWVVVGVAGLLGVFAGAVCVRIVAVLVVVVGLGFGFGFGFGFGVEVGGASGVTAGAVVVGATTVVTGAVVVVSAGDALPPASANAQTWPAHNTTANATPASRRRLTRPPPRSC
ncbi:MAG: hypothetical protein ACTHKS_13500 [Gaiellaceae bacterium]